MQKSSLPNILQLALQQHASAADIDNDEELKTILTKLSELGQKVEDVKLKAKNNRQLKN